MKPMVTNYSKIFEKAALYKVIETNFDRSLEIQLKFYNVSEKSQEALGSFIETALQNNSTLNYLYDAFNNVKLPMFMENSFITVSNKDESIFIVYGIKK